MTSRGALTCLNASLALPATRTWTLVTPASDSDAFPARSGHSAVALGHVIVVFGGLDLRAGEVFNDVYFFDTRAFVVACLADVDRF